MSGYSKDEVGEITEKMFIEAANRHRPWWIQKVERTDPKWDVKGIDAIAYLRYSLQHIERVPIQVRSSEGRVEEYYREKPWAVKWKVIAIPVELKARSIDISDRLCAELRIARREQRSYKEFWKEREAVYFGSISEELASTIKTNRASKIGNYHRSKIPPPTNLEVWKHWWKYLY